MSSLRALPALALTAICLTLVTAPANAAPPPSPTTREMVNALARQGVPAQQIWAVDPAGIPMVCAEPSRVESFAAALSGPASAVLAAGTRSWEAVPSVIRSDGVDSFRFEVDVNGPVSRVHFANVFPCLKPPQPPPFDLRDDGTGGDRVAGDSIYTSGEFRYDTACPFSPPAFFRYDSTSPAGIWVQTIGDVFVEELNGDQNRFLIQPAVGLMLPALPAAEIRQLTPDVAVSPHLVNVRTNQRSTQSTLRFSSFTIPELTATIYEALPDAFDFLMFFSIDHIERLPQLTLANFYAGLNYPVQWNYSGTGGGSPFDNSAYYGSHGRLLSLNFLDTQERGLYSGNAMHEITHQWASYTSMSLGLADGTAHYHFRTSAASLVGGFRFIDLGNGSFVHDCNEGRNGAHRAPPLDRYMAGLIPGSEVPPLHVYSSSLPNPVFLCGQTFSALDRTVTIEEIQAVHGVRTPGPEAARRDFAVAFVAESFNRLLTQTEMTYYEILAEHFAHEVPAAEPDPYLGFNWVSGTRYWGPGVTWTSAVPLEPAFAEAAFDLKPGSCPSQVNLGSRGVVPAAVLGTAQLDVRTIDPASLRVLGLAPLRTAREDVAAPFFPLLGRDEARDCTAQGPDGRLDLTLKLSTTDLQRAVQQVLGRAPRDGELVVLPLTGRLLPEHGGGEIRGEDVLVVLAKGK
jgi:hypothetical protein